jgi:hypothetical protein
MYALFVFQSVGRGIYRVNQSLYFAYRRAAEFDAAARKKTHAAQNLLQTNKKAGASPAFPFFAYPPVQAG